MCYPLASLISIETALNLRKLFAVPLCAPKLGIQMLVSRSISCNGMFSLKTFQLFGFWLALTADSGNPLLECWTPLNLQKREKRIEVIQKSGCFWIRSMWIFYEFPRNNLHWNSLKSAFNLLLIPFIQLGSSLESLSKISIEIGLLFGRLFRNQFGFLAKF